MRRRGVRLIRKGAIKLIRRKVGKRDKVDEEEGGEEDKVDKEEGG